MSISKTDADALTPSSHRYQFIDQCRGYAIFGMILVNVLGMFECMPWMLKHHHEGFSYADHIAPMFMFVVGMGFRMSFIKTLQTEGPQLARKRAIRRYCIIMGLGLLYGGFSLRVGVWDALMDIGVSGMLALPFMADSSRVRLCMAALYLALFQAFYSCTPYGEWLMHNSINGGPLGPLSWVFILLMGTVAADCVSSKRNARMLLFFVCMAVMLSVIGWLLRMEWNGTKQFWPFSQYAMSAPYPIYATGLCFFTVLFFYVLCEWFGIVTPHLTTLGRNPLVLYLLQAALVLLVRVIVPSDVSIVGALLCLGFVYGACYIVAYRLYSSGKIIKI